MNKIVPVFMLAILVASFAGFGYSLWSENLTLTGTIDTTYMDVEWSKHCAYDNESKTVWGPNLPGSSIVATIDPVNKNLMTVAITEAYPCVKYDLIFDIKSVGPLPVHIHNMVLTIVDETGKPIPVNEFPGTITVGHICDFNITTGSAAMGTSSYLQWNFGQGWQRAWCVDEETLIYVPDTYDVKLFCSYQFGLPYPSPEMSECNWGKVNWIINHWEEYVGDPTVEANYMEAQEAIWYLFGEIGTVTGPAAEMVEDAVCCFIPNCAMGEKAAVLVYAPHPNDPGVYQWTITEMCCCCEPYAPDDITEEIQLHQGDSAWFCLSVHLDNSAVQDNPPDTAAEYTFTIQALVHQYNECPGFG